jgi:hypothetical protein
MEPESTKGILLETLYCALGAAGRVHATVACLPAGRASSRRNRPPDSAATCAAVRVQAEVEVPDGELVFVAQKSIMGKME